HLHQLVDQHVAGRADIALETEPSAHQEILAEGASIAEFRKLQFNTFHTVERHGEWIGIVGQLQDIHKFGRRLGAGRYHVKYFHHATCFSAKRAALAAALNGSMPTRRSVAMKVSALPSTLWRCRL